MVALLGSFTVESFSPLVGERFRIDMAEGALDLVLSEASGLPVRPSGRRPFTLLFHQPEGVLVRQATYAVSHPALGTFDLFLVPLGPDASGMRYEAVFG